MQRAANEVAEECGDMLRKSGEKAITMKWPEFYELNTMKRFTNERHAELRQAFMAEGLIVGFGNHAIVITHDSNHSKVG